MEYVSIINSNRTVRKENLSITTPNEFNHTIKNILQFKSFAKNTCLTGNVINIRFARGITYFTLIDEQSQISCIYFGIIELQQDKAYLVQGDLNFYTPKGTYSLNVTDAYKEYKSKAKLNYEAIKKRLENQGKKSNNKIFKGIPKKIGIITSKNSDAENDILEILKSKLPTKIIFYYIPSQGKKVANELIFALKKLNQNKCEIIAISRGGGSYDDLDAFNNEEIADEILKSKAVIYTGIGHHKDKTITDLVADKNFGTPSTLAQNILLGKNEVKKEIQNILSKLDQIYLNTLQNKLHLADTQNSKLDYHYTQKLHFFEMKIMQLAKKVETYNHEAALNQGYTMTLKDGLMLQKYDVNDQMLTITKNQNIKSKITKIEEKNDR